MVVDAARIAGQALAQHHLHLVAVAPPCPQQRVVQLRRVVDPPRRRRRVQGEEVDVAVLGHGAQHVEVADGEAGEAEEAEAFGQVRPVPGRRGARRTRPWCAPPGWAGRARCAGGATARPASGRRRAARA